MVRRSEKCWRTLWKAANNKRRLKLKAQKKNLAQFSARHPPSDGSCLRCVLLDIRESCGAVHTDGWRVIVNINCGWIIKSMIIYYVSVIQRCRKSQEWRKIFLPNRKSLDLKKSHKNNSQQSFSFDFPISTSMSSSQSLLNERCAALDFSSYLAANDIDPSHYL